VVARRLRDVRTGCETSPYVADVPSITLVQKFTYRDLDEEFSNRYHFTGTPPADYAGWHTLATALGTLVASVFSSNVHIVRAYGYLSDGTDSVMTVDYTVGGLSPIAGTAGPVGVFAPGDDAMTVRWDTGRRNSRGKAIYLRKYYHGVGMDSSDSDKVDSSQLGALAALGTSLLSDWGSTTSKLCGPDGVTPTLPHASPWITTRTLKRRGRRPPS
jgi:hypothetical protein